MSTSNIVWAMQMHSSHPAIKWQCCGDSSVKKAMNAIPTLRMSINLRKEEERKEYTTVVGHNGNINIYFTTTCLIVEFLSPL